MWKINSYRSLEHILLDYNASSDRDMEPLAGGPTTTRHVPDILYTLEFVSINVWGGKENEGEGGDLMIFVVVVVPVRCWFLGLSMD